MAKIEPRKRSKLWPLVAVFAIAAAAYIAISQPWTARPAQVTTEVTASGPVSQVLAVNGRIAARISVTVRAAVSAQVRDVAASEGQKVASGDVLLTLDTAIIHAQVEQASAALEAQHALERQAKAAVDRSRALGSNSPRAALEDAEFALASARQETARLDAALRQVKRQLDEYTIRAPMDGVVITRTVDPGQLVDPQRDLFVVADTSDLIVETDVDELYSAHIGEGLTALLRPVGASVAQQGKIVFAAPKVDSVTRGRQIKIAFDQPVSLPIGLTVNANIIVKEIDAALSLPRRAIVTEDGRSHVLVLQDGVIVRRDIRFNDWPSDRVVISEGLTEGETVVLDPTSVKAGDKAVAG